MSIRAVGPERAAKAAVLNFLRENGKLRADSSIVSELELRTAGQRADLVVTGTQFIAIEIKTHADSLSRLGNQASLNSRAFPRSYVALATKHLARGVSIAPCCSGVLELVDAGGRIEAREIRPAKLVRTLDAESQLSLAPVGALKRLLQREKHRSLSKRSRSELVRLAITISSAKRTEFLDAYLSEKYSRTSKAFHDATSGREIHGADLDHLRAWPERQQELVAPDIDVIFFRSLSERFGEMPLGPIPDDVRRETAGAFQMTA